jgi:hypothetical protein
VPGSVRIEMMLNSFGRKRTGGVGGRELLGTDRQRSVPVPSSRATEAYERPERFEMTNDHDIYYSVLACILRCRFPT